MDVILACLSEKKTHNLPKDVAIEASLAHKCYEELLDKFFENEEKDEN